MPIPSVTENWRQRPIAENVKTWKSWPNRRHCKRNWKQTNASPKPKSSSIRKRIHTISIWSKAAIQRTTKAKNHANDHRRHHGVCHTIACRTSSLSRTSIPKWWTASFRWNRVKLIYDKFSPPSMTNICAETLVPYGIRRRATHWCQNTENREHNSIFSIARLILIIIIIIITLNANRIARYNFIALYSFVHTSHA